MSLTLKFLSGPLKGKVLNFNKDPEIIFGRKDDCDIVLKDPRMSGEHCGIFYENGDYIIEDFESTNGTFINTSKLTGDTTLKTGDTIFLGSSRISVNIAQQPLNIPSSTPKQNNTSAPNVQNNDFDMDDEDTNVKKLARSQTSFKSVFSVDFYIDLKEKFSALSAIKKILIIAVFLFAFGGIVVVSFGGNNEEGGGLFGPKDLSEKVYKLGPEVRGKVWGYWKSAKGSSDFSHPSKVRFKFNYEQGHKIIIHYLVANVLFFDEVIIKINDYKIGQTPTTPPGGKSGGKIAIPIENLNPEGNVIEFINTRNLASGKKKKKWGLAITKIDDKILPKPDFNKAKENYLLAEKFYTQKKIYRGNRYKAFTHYEKSIYFMELMKTKPDFYNDCLEKMKMIDKELWEIYKNARYMAKRSIDFGNYEKAEQYIYRIVEEIPNDSDSRYKTAQKFLNFLSRKK